MIAQSTEFSEQLAVLSAGWRSLPDKPEETPESTLRALWFLAAGDPRSIARAGDDQDLPDLSTAQLSTLSGLVARRLAGEPLAYLTGRQQFLGLELESTPEALIPRAETELLGRKAIELVRAAPVTDEGLWAMDVCTGSGNLALAVAYHVPEARLVATDLSADAVRLARANAARLGLQDRVRFESGDLFAAFDSEEFYGRFDVVICNPPYISSAKVARMPEEIAQYEPRLAFDGGSFGFDILMRLLNGAPRFLRPGGMLCFELGLGQGKFVAERARRTNLYSDLQLVADAAGEPRVIVARTKDGSGVAAGTEVSAGEPSTLAPPSDRT